MDFSSYSFHDGSLSGVDDMFVDPSAFESMDSATCFDGDVNDSFDTNLRQAAHEYFDPANHCISGFVSDFDFGENLNAFDINATGVDMAIEGFPYEAAGSPASHGKTGAAHSPYGHESSATPQGDSMSPASSSHTYITSPDSASPKTPPVPEKKTRRKKVKTLEEQQKQKQLSLEKNRIAARKSRVKKKDDQQELYERHNYLEQENLRLKAVQNEMVQLLSAMRFTLHVCKPPDCIAPPEP